MKPGKPRRKALDAHLACLLVYPLRHTRITPNHLTTLRLGFGLAAAGLIAQGTYLLINLGALCFVFSFFLDHTDGELARLTGRMSQFGHAYDLLSDLLINTLLFISIGIGLMRTGMEHAAGMGLLAGLSVLLAVIYHDRLVQLSAEAKDNTAASGQYVELEDILYLFPLITLFDQLPLFLAAAAIGAPLFALWVLARCFIFTPGKTK